MDNKIYTIEEINILINLLKKNLNMDFYFDNLNLNEIKKNEKYLDALRKITHATRDHNILSKVNLIDELNNEIIKYNDIGEEKTYCIEAINEFINILNS
jgi:hypothetical protein